METDEGGVILRLQASQSAARGSTRDRFNDHLVGGIKIEVLTNCSQEEICSHDKVVRAQMKERVVILSILRNDYSDGLGTKKARRNGPLEKRSGQVGLEPRVDVVFIGPFIRI